MHIVGALLVLIIALIFLREIAGLFFLILMALIVGGTLLAIVSHPEETAVGLFTLVPFTITIATPVLLIVGAIKIINLLTGCEFILYDQDGKKCRNINRWTIWFSFCAFACLLPVFIRNDSGVNSLLWVALSGLSLFNASALFFGRGLAGEPYWAGRGKRGEEKSRALKIVSTFGVGEKSLEIFDMIKEIRWERDHLSLLNSAKVKSVKFAQTLNSTSFKFEDVYWEITAQESPRKYWSEFGHGGSFQDLKLLIKLDWIEFAEISYSRSGSEESLLTHSYTMKELMSFTYNRQHLNSLIFLHSRLKKILDEVSRRKSIKEQNERLASEGKRFKV